MSCRKLINRVCCCTRFVHIAALLGVLVLAHHPVLAADAPSPSVNPSEPPKTAGQFSVDGYISAKYVYRSTTLSNERLSDQDLFTDLRLDVARPEQDRYEFHFFGTARSDLDGESDRKDYYPFEDIGNARSSRSAGYLYEAHIDVNRPLAYVTQVRVGRQSGTRDEPVFFDGLAADIKAARTLNLAVYGGAAVHFYEIANRWGDDTLAGAGVDYTPFTSGGLSLDYLSARDERELFSFTDQNDELYAVKLWYRFSPGLKATVKYRGINSESRDANARVIGVIPGIDLEVSANYFRQSHTQNELTNEFSSYYDILGQSHPYQSYDIKARKLFGARYAVDLGYYKRSLLKDLQQGAFNREYERTFVDFEIADALTDGLSFMLIGELWKSVANEFSSGGLDVGYALPKKKNAKLSAGTYYSLYKYDYYTALGERDHVRTYYINGKYPFSGKYSANAGYEYETGLERFQTVKLGIRYDF